MKKSKLVHSVCTLASMISGATRLDSMYSCSGRYSPLQSLLMFGAEFVPRAVVLSPVCTTLNNVHITVGMIMEWHASINETKYTKMQNETKIY
jgi:hypothetical protein